MEGGTGMSGLITGIGDVTTIVGSVFTMITGNPLLAVFVSASLVGVGIAVFQQAKGAARG